MEPQNNNTSVNFSRRSLLKGTLAASSVGALNFQNLAAAEDEASQFKLKKGDVILFQGDSITDAGRRKNNLEPNEGMGRGYAAMLAGDIISDYPELGLKFYNRGISGNKVPDLASRWDEDAIKLKPSVISIMIGINDLWHTVAFGRKYKATVKDYDAGYRKLLDRTLKELPGVHIIICEPFELRKWKEFDPYREVAKKIADDYKLTFVPFHSAFVKAAEIESTNGKYWAWDGIHPSIGGHTLMRKVWRKSTGI